MKSEFVDLGELFARGRDSRHPVFFGDALELHWGAFSQFVFTLASELADREEERWCLTTEHPASFAVGLFSLLYAGKTVVLPANTQEGSLKELKDVVDAYLLEKRVRGLEKVQAFIPATSGTVLYSRRRLPSLDLEQAAIELYTSGSTGQRKCVRKALQHLAAEVQVLETAWGQQIGNAVVYSTVSHQHIYGLLYHVLWPLAAGRACYAERILYPEALSKLWHGRAEVCLISSPSHLERMPDLISLTAFAGTCRAVFSSGAPLSRSAALSLRAELGQAPIEVFGSTETGGVAWRQRDGSGDESWRALERVELREQEGLLQVNSPFVSSNHPWFEMGDSVELLDRTRFVHRGRTDRIYKLEGKRVSLPEMGERLAQHQYVETARVVPVEGVGTSRREVLGAVLVLSTEGNSCLAQNTKRSLIRELSEHLLLYHDRVTLPRRWRFVPALPQDAQGKTSLQALQAVFSTDGNEQPRVLSEEHSENSSTWELRVPADFVYCDGHFPAYPIVPGFVLVDWAMAFARRRFAIPSAVRSLEAVKFHRFLKPDAVCLLTVELHREKGVLQFVIEEKREKCCSGRVRLWGDGGDVS